jgi:hypothetical protein
VYVCPKKGVLGKRRKVMPVRKTPFPPPMTYLKPKNNPPHSL